MDSGYALNDCLSCGLSDSEKEPVEEKETIKDTVDEAKKYSNPEIPLWVKLVAAGIGIIAIKKFS